MAVRSSNPAGLGDVMAARWPHAFGRDVPWGDSAVIAPDRVCAMSRVRSEAPEEGDPMSSNLGGRLHRLLVPVPRLEPPIHPALLRRERERAEVRQNRAADAITTFAGSMLFVYLHVIWFACWIGAGVEDYPYGLLTMIVSLEAIFLSTFVMISQNRADARRQVIADHQWKTVQEEDKQNVELPDLSKQLLALTPGVRYSTRAARGAAEPEPGP